MRNGYLSAFVVGAGVGAVVALLFAPRSGKETREYLGKKCEEGSDFVTAKSKEIRKQAERFADRGKAFAERVARA